MKPFVVVGKSEVILNLVANTANLKAHFVSAGRTERVLSIMGVATKIEKLKLQPV